MRKVIINIFLGLAVFLLLGSTLGRFLPRTSTKDVALSEISQAIQSGQVTELSISKDSVNAKQKDSDVRLVASLGETIKIPEFFKDTGVSADKLSALKISYVNDGFVSILVSIVLPTLIPLVVIGLLVLFFMRQVQGANSRAMSFGQSTAKLNDETKVQVKFDDVAGAKEAKSELVEVVEFLKFPEKFHKLGAKTPKGVLLLGSPGVGKTLLARAVAGEANVPFFHMSGSEFVEMFVGVGASRVRDLFRRAKKASPCILFIDEIDAVGRMRGAGLGGGNDEREQTLNQILVEMDGFDNETNVIVIAATNRADVLDPALLRPGRFDRQVIIDLPDIHDREAILTVHAKNKPLAPEANLRIVAERTSGFSGADLANVLNEGAIVAARHNSTTVSLANLLEAIEKVLLGPQRQSHLLSAEEKKVTAYHEAGHALLATVLPHANPVHKVTILPRGRAAGYTLHLPLEDRKMQTKSSFLDDICVAMGGYVAEKLVFNDLTTGASNDLKVASNSARKLVTLYGMSDVVGPVSLGEQGDTVFLGRELSEQRHYSEQTAQQIDSEIRRIMTEAETSAMSYLTQHREVLDKIAARLQEVETIEQGDFEALVGELLSDKKKRIKT